MGFLKTVIVTFMFAVVVLCILGMLDNAWIINGANQAAEGCEDDPGLSSAHKRAAWSLSIYIFAGIGAAVLGLIAFFIPGI